MEKLCFDIIDYSVVVKSRGAAPNPWKWEIYRAGTIESDWAVADLFSLHGGRKQSRKSSAEAAIV